LYTALHALTSTMFSIIMSRLERDRPSIKLVDKFIFKEITRSASSPHVIMVFIMCFMAGTMLYGLALFLPSIVSQLGFSPNKTEILSVGPFVVGFFGANFLWRNQLRLMYALLTPLVTLISAYSSDRYESRGITIALLSVLAVVGFALYLGKVLCF
jgi:ABC-type Na+ efflux pump permease subunit